MLPQIISSFLFSFPFVFKWSPYDPDTKGNHPTDCNDVKGKIKETTSKKNGVPNVLHVEGGLLRPLLRARSPPRDLFQVTKPGPAANGDFTTGV